MQSTLLKLSFLKRINLISMNKKKYNLLTQTKVANWTILIIGVKWFPLAKC